MFRSCCLALSLGLVTVLAGCRSDAGDQAAWIRFTSDTGRFSAELPAEPTEQTQQVPSAGGSLKLVGFTAASDEETASVSYVDYPIPASGEDAKRVVESAVEGIASAVQGQILEKTPTTSPDGEAVDFTVEAAAQQLTGRVLMAGSRMYVLLIVEPLRSRSESFERLAGSFRLLPGSDLSPSPSLSDPSGGITHVPPASSP